MHKTIISDTSCFIILSKIGELELLHKLYGQIITILEFPASLQFLKSNPLPLRLYKEL